LILSFSYPSNKSSCHIYWKDNCPQISLCSLSKQRKRITMDHLIGSMLTKDTSPVGVTWYIVLTVKNVICLYFLMKTIIWQYFSVCQQQKRTLPVIIVVFILVIFISHKKDLTLWWLCITFRFHISSLFPHTSPYA
jgi:hypothetical protein